MTRSRAQTPLPALPTKQSHAYGAQGKAQLSHQVSTSAADFSQTFAKSRARGSTRAPSVQPSVSTTPAPQKQAHKPQALRDESESIINGPALDTTVDDDGAENDGEVRPATSLHHSAAYVSPTAARGERSPPPPPSRQEGGAHAPANIRVFIHTLPKYIKHVVNDTNMPRVKDFLLMSLPGIIIGLLLAALLLAVGAVPLPLELEAFRGKVLGLTDVPLRWARFTHEEAFRLHLAPNISYPDVQVAINQVLLNRIDGNINTTRDLAAEIAVQSHAIAELNRILPNTIVATLDNGQYVVPPTFWQALVDKMSSNDGAPLWDGFIATNNAKIASMALDAVNGDLQNGELADRLLTKEVFHEAIRESNRRMHSDLHTEMRQIKTETLREAMVLYKDYLEKSEIMAMARAEIAAVSQSNVVFNIDKALREVNYFSVGMGALVDPKYTSKTRHPRTNTLGKWLVSKTGVVTKKPHPPAIALLPWSEATDCWCADSTTSEEGMAQLAVKLQRKIYPRELTIEHIPGPATRDIASAPKDFEVWVQLDNATEAARVQEHLDIHIPPRFDDFQDGCVGKPPSGEKNWVCVAADRYHIHSHNFIQSFIIWPATEHMQMAASRIAVRVLRNWGSEDHTCMYRVRITGSEVGGDSN